MTDRMYCEMYSCKMSIDACIKRQKNARIGPGSGQYIKPGALDINCANCKQGKEIEKNYIDRLQDHIRLLVERYENIPQDVWDALTKKLYELVEKV